ncbi:MAG TPA: efflux RND transporter periplasmic adaptor subunit [Pyrinomonadaceae bacterium]|jgi:RND family efflux transporter MFP subunit|nr:efflux RND transporter periplasmic adaptor subunit [Pyrinomonadaceae bacterium]
MSEAEKYETPASKAGLFPLALSLFALSLVISCKSDYPASARQGSPGGSKTVRQVKTTQVVETPFGETVTANGTLAAFDQTTASVKVPGRLKTIVVDLGTVVSKGQVIAQVEPEDYRLRVQQAEASLAQARARLGLAPDGTDDNVDPEKTATVRQARAVLDEARFNRDRAQKLVEQGVIAKAEFDTANATFKVAEGRYQDAYEEIRNRQGVLAQRRSELALARQQLKDTAVVAPLDGIVQEKRASTGEYLAAGAPVVNIVRMDPLRLRAEIPERESHTVRTGQNVRVTVDGDSTVYVGQIMRLSPVIAEQNRMLVVEADVRNNGKLRPGSFAHAEIVTNDAKMAVTVPNNAIVTFAGIEKVLVVQNGKALERPITTGRRNGEFTEIVAGISVGEKVILEPGNLQTGQEVQVVE